MYLEKNGNIIHSTAIIGENVKLGTNNLIMPFAVIGSAGFIRDFNESEGTIEIGNNNKIGCHTAIMAGEKGITKIGSNNLIMNFVNIGHNTIIEDDCEIGAGTIIAGHVRIESDVKIKIACCIRNRSTIAKGLTIGMGAVVVDKNINNNGLPVFGNPAK